MSFSPAQVDSISSGLQGMLLLQWISIVGFFAFLILFGWIAWRAWRQFQVLRGRRLLPILNETKTIARKTVSIGKKLGTRGKSIVEVALKTAEEVSVKAQTTANVVKGAMPEARRLPGELSATTDDLRVAMKTADTVRTAARAVRGFQAVSQIAASVRSVVKSAQATSQSRPEDIPASTSTVTTTVPTASTNEAAREAAVAEKQEQELKS